MPNTKTKKFDWQIFLAVSCILLVICCATICCVIGNTEKGVANAYEPETVVSNTNKNLSIFDFNNNSCYNVLYFNPYADFNIAFSAMYIYSDLRYSGEDYAVKFFTLYFGQEIYAKSFFINYPEENKYVFLLTTDDGYSNIEDNSFREYYPTTSTLVESYANDFARILIVCDFDTENYVFTVSTLLYSDFYTAYDDAPFRVIRNYDIADETGLYFMDTMFSFNTNFFITNMSFHDLPRFKFIFNNDIVYLNYRMSNYDYQFLDEYFINQEDFMNSPYFDDDIYDGENGILLATFLNGLDTYDFYYSWTWGGFAFVINDTELINVIDYSFHNFGFVNNRVSSFRYIYDNSEERLYKLNVVSTTPIFDEYYYEFHTMFSGTYNFLTYDTALMYKAIGTASDSSYENGYQTGVNEGYNQGFSAGHTAGYDTGYDEGYNVGETAGYQNGYNAGETAGYQSGYAEGRVDGIVEANTSFSDGYQAALESIKTVNLTSNIEYFNRYSYQYVENGLWEQADTIQINSQVWLNNTSSDYLFTTKYFNLSNLNGLVSATSYKNFTLYAAERHEGGSSLSLTIAVESLSESFSISFYDGSILTYTLDLSTTYQNGIPVSYGSLPIGYPFTHIVLNYIDSNALFSLDAINQIVITANNIVIDSYNTALDVGFNNGYVQGYSVGVSDASDYSFFSLFSAIFDAPITSIVGKWGDSDGDGVYEREGGMLNFYIPGLDINFAPFLLSLFTIAIIVLIIRFILARKS